MLDPEAGLPPTVTGERANDNAGSSSMDIIEVMRQNYVRDVPAEMAALQGAFVDRIVQVVREIEEVWSGITQEDWETAVIDDMYSHVQRLSGVGGTLGFARVNEAAQKLEQVIVKMLDQPTYPPPDLLKQFEANFKELHEAVRETPQLA